MFRTANIRKVIIGVPVWCSEAAVYHLGREALLHLHKQNAPEDEAGAPLRAKLSDRLTEADNLLSKLSSLMAALNIPPRQYAGDGRQPDVESDASALKSIQQKIQQKEAISRRLSEAIARLRDYTKLDNALRAAGVDLSELTGLSLCTVAYGHLPGDQQIPPPDRPDRFSIMQLANQAIGICLPGHVHDMLAFLHKYGFRDDTAALLSKAGAIRSADSIERRIGVLESRRGRAERGFNRLRASWTPLLQKLHRIYTETYQTLRAEQQLIFSGDVVFITGWVVSDNKKKVTEILDSVCPGTYLVSISDAPDPDAPVQFKNSRFFRPFELLVKSAGLPSSTEIDPTPFTALTYAVMFGVMFGDVGQGFVLILTGTAFKYISRHRRKLPAWLCDAGSILQCCGVSAAVFGVLYGSIFSNEHIIPALWFHPMDNIMPLFFAVIMMGSVFITAGLLLNIINGALARDWPALLFGGHGLPGLILYVGSVVLALRYFTIGVVPSPAAVSCLAVLPLCVFSFRSILAWAIFGLKKPFPLGVFHYCAETAVELMEMLSGFLSHTVSFIRAGAFALSHAGLGIAIYCLAEIVSPDLLSPAALAVLVVGNIFIILLEGLVCGIQSMRLEYYELMGTFYRGTGSAFTPFSLQTNTTPSGR